MWGTIWDDTPKWPKKQTQAQVVLELLMERPVTTTDLTLISRKYLTRLNELRLAGWRIRCRRRRGKDSRFYLEGYYNTPQLEIKARSMTAMQVEVSLRASAASATTLRAVLTAGGFTMSDDASKTSMLWTLFRNLAFAPLHRPMCDYGLADYEWFGFAH